MEKADGGLKTMTIFLDRLFLHNNCLSLVLTFVQKHFGKSVQQYIWCNGRSSD